MKKISLKKNAIANYIGQFYSILIGMAILPLYLQYLGAEAYGLTGFFTMLMSWMMLLDIGMTSTLARESARLKDKVDGLKELKELIRSIEALFVVVALIMVTIIYISSDIIATHWLTVHDLSIATVENSIKLMGLMVVMRWFVGFYQGAIVGFEMQVWLNSYKVFFNTLKFVGAFFLIKYISNDVFHFFEYQLIISVLELLVINYKVYNILPSTPFNYPAIKPIKNIAPFALSIAFTTGVWILFTQMDKLLLSHYIPLSQYGYFTLVIIISGAILQLSSPISQAVLPRMTILISYCKEEEMLGLYHQATQYVVIVVFAVVAIVSTFSYEILYTWSGDEIASEWAAPILFWYVLGNAILAILAFQYYLQYAYGNLKYHVKFNIYYPIISLPIIYFSVVNYGALGAGIAWFSINFVSFLFWPVFIHYKFAKGLHSEWIIKDILPAFTASASFSLLFDSLDIDLMTLNSVARLILLMFLGFVLLVINALSYPNLRSILIKKINFKVCI